MSENISFSERLNYLVEFTGLNQNQIAKKSGVSPSSFGKALKGAGLSLDNAIKLVSEFNIDANWLLLGIGDPKRKKICFDNEVEIARYISENKDKFKNLNSFTSLLGDFEDSEFKNTVDRRLQLMEEKINNLKNG